jgi:hypothetical protein
MDLVLEFFSFCLQFIFWFWIFSLFFRLILRIEERKLETNLIVLQKLEKLIHQVTVEKYGDEYYWFDADNHEFLVQGKDVEEALDKLKKRYPNHVFFVTDDAYQYRVGAATKWKLEPYKAAGVNTRV